MTPIIETRRGVPFRPLSPSARDVHIDDIAHALSNQCRFAGHTRTFYSVADHCVRVSALLEAWGEDVHIQLWGLLHDASEAYLVDLPSPLKIHGELGAAYRAAEERLMQTICVRFGLPRVEPAIVRRADAVLLATEARDLMAYRAEHWASLTEAPMPLPISPRSPDEARHAFLQRFTTLNQARTA
jgi:5'-deoxynucleotidase YfbR-like HD superfamily hydrolase